MTNITYEDVLRSFESLFMDKYELPDELIRTWFVTAITRYSMEILPLKYDNEIGMFMGDIPFAAPITLAYMMKTQYLEREVSRVNKLNNIVGKDISLNGTGDTKRFVAQELSANEIQIADWLNKQKSTAFD